MRHVDTVCLVAEPYYRSLEAVRRMAALVVELPVGRVVVVANKVRSPGDGEAIAEFCHRHAFELAGSVPWNDEVVAADRAPSPSSIGRLPATSSARRRGSPAGSERPLPPRPCRRRRWCR